MKQVHVHLFYLKRLYNMCNNVYVIYKCIQENIKFVKTTGTRGTDLPPPFFSNFLFTDLFSIKFLYFFIISYLFPYFNLIIPKTMKLVFVASPLGMQH